MDSSTTPRLGPRWPPVLATAVIRNSLISWASAASSSLVSALRSCGPRMFSSSGMLGSPPRLSAHGALAGRAQRLLERAHGGQAGGGLVAAVGHAVVAARVLAPAVLVPVGLLDQLAVGGDVSVAHQVAGPLPAEERVVGDAPGGAREVGPALQEVQEERAVVEPPAPAVAARERLPEQLAGLLDPQEVLLVGCLLVGVGGRDHHLVHLEVVVEEVEHLDDGLRAVGVEEGGVGGDPEAAPLGLLDGRHGLVED